MERYKTFALILLSFSAVLLSACADLMVREIALTPPSPTTQTEITFGAVVENVGIKSSGPSTLAFQVGGETVPKYYEVPSLDLGETHAVQRNLRLGVAQNYQITVTADVNNDVTELREGNNQAIKYFSVAPVPNPPNITPLVLAPVDDRTARAKGGYTGNFTELDLADLGQLYAYASFNSDTSDALRAILEFELPNALQGKEILSAEFYFRRTIANGSPDTSGFKVYGYVGNGTVELGDALQVSSQLGETLRMWDLEQHLDVTDFIKTFDISSNRYPGFVVRGHNGQGGLYSSEGFAENYRPTLTIMYR